MYRVLVLGANGMLAHDVAAEAPGGVELVSLDSRQLDITNDAALAASISELRPQVVVNCAAYTDVDGAESNRDRAVAVNGRAPGSIAGILAAHRRHQDYDPLLVHFSTDYVFDGSSGRPYREDDPPAPIGAYGASKLTGEENIGRSGARHLILRTQWLFGLHGRSFPRTMWQRAMEGTPTRVVNDQTGRLTYTVDLARACWRLVERDRQIHDARGVGEARILHVANEGTATWYDVAEHVFRRAGRTELLTPCSTSEFPRPARRPQWSVLDTSRFEGLTGHPLPDWTDALDRFLDLLQAR